jgi:hypothetical protein
MVEDEADVRHSLDQVDSLAELRVPHAQVENKVLRGQQGDTRARAGPAGEARGLVLDQPPHPTTSGNRRRSRS